MKSKKDKRQNIRYRIRKTIKGTADFPRLAVFRSNKQIYAQIIDDVAGNTIVAASSKDKSLEGEKVTKAKSFESAHNYGLGADFSIFHPTNNKKVLWDDKYWEDIAKIADEYDLQNLTMKSDKFHDPGHFMPKGWKKPDDADDQRQQYYDSINNFLKKQGGLEPSKKKTAYPEPKSARLLEYQRSLKEDATE